MFSGIIETTTPVLAARERAGVIQLTLEKPKQFEGFHTGDSIAVDGVCLTLEAQDERSLSFALGPETLAITGWTAPGVKGRVVNVERSLCLGERIHGHLVTGHVDASAQVLQAQIEGEARRLTIELPAAVKPFVWQKGSVAVNGVSLTVNRVSNGTFEVGLIPETLKRTNLGTLQPGARANIEADNMARGLIHWAEGRKDARP